MGYPILLVVVDTVGPFGWHALIGCLLVRASCNVSFDAEVTNPEAKMSFVFRIVCNLDFIFCAGVSLLSWVKSEHISVWKGSESFFNRFAYGEQFKFGSILAILIGHTMINKLRAEVIPPPL